MKQSGSSMRQSAGILLYRLRHGAADNDVAAPEVLLVHPGGPFWKNKDLGAWSIPKGEFRESEEALAAARREFREETGFEVPDGVVQVLPPVKQNRSKSVFAFAVEGSIDASLVRSNTFRMEFPPKSGRWIDVPEVDRAGWFGVDEARQKLLPGQVPLVDALLAVLAR